MGKSFLPLFFLSALLSFATGASAQEYDHFFRGRQESGYQVIYNGHPWWDTPDYFKESSLMYSGKRYDGLSLNLNANTQTLQVLRGEDYTPVALETSLVRWFTLGENLFVNLSLLGFDSAERGFYMMVHDGPVPVLYRVNKNLRSDTVEANGKLIGYVDPKYKSSVTNFFEFSEAYIIIKDSTVVKLRNKSAVKALLDRKQRSLLRSYRSATLQEYCVAAAEILSRGLVPESALALDSRFADTPYAVEHGKAMLSKAPELPSRLPLAESWFMPDLSEGGTVRYVSGVPVVAIYRNKVYELGNRSSKLLPSYLIQGHVTDSEDGKPVMDAVVYDRRTGNYTSTDANGYWALEVASGDNIISFSESLMDDFPVMVNVRGKAVLNVVMSPKSELLNGVVISADARAAHRTPRMGVEKLSIKSLSRVPTAFGEGDVLKAVQSLPGVQSVGEASGGINVRGGSADQNLILYNGSTIYNPTHLFGVFSAFDPNMVENVELYKSSIPAEYGGRLSSVMNVRGKDGNFDKFRGALGIGVLTSHLMLEGPLGRKHNTSFVLGCRTSYSDYIMGLLPASSGYSGGSASFSDVSASLTHKFGKSDVIRAGVYWSNDGFGFSKDTTFRYSNLNAIVQLEKSLSDKLQLNASAAYDSFGGNLYDTHDDYAAYHHCVGVQQISEKLGFKANYIKNHELGAGLEGVTYIMNLGRLDPYAEDSAVLPSRVPSENGTQMSAWISDTWTISRKLTADAGLRYAMFFTDGASYSHPEIRLSAKYSANENLSFKTGFNTMTQFIHLISNTTSISPMDVWKLSDPDIKPQTGHQAALGAYYTAGAGMWDFSLETYTKKTSHTLDFKSGANLFMNENIADDLVQTVGKAYGVEFMAKKNAGALNGWISYTYSRSLLKEDSTRGVYAINHGNWYSAPYDKPHSLQVVGNYEFTHRYSMSFNLDYSTGRPVTVPIGHYYYENAHHLLYSDRNAYRIPDYFRLDLAMNIQPNHNLRQLTHFTCTFGVYNVTARKNAYSVYYTTAASSVTGHMVSVFAVPIPYVSVNMKF